MSAKQPAAPPFTQQEPGLHCCNICEVVRKQAPRTGYSNLMSHLNAKHPTHDEEYAEFQRRNMSSLEVFGFVDQDTSDMYDWMRLVIERNMPLSEVEEPLTRQLVKMWPATAETLKAYMRRVAVRVGVTVAAEMGSLFGLMIDGWSSASNHYIGVYAVYRGEDGHRERLIGLSPMVGGQTADVHIESLNTILGVYEKDYSMVKFLVGDNCSTNQSIATKLNIHWSDAPVIASIFRWASSYLSLRSDFSDSDYDDASASDQQRF